MKIFAFIAVGLLPIGLTGAAAPPQPPFLAKAAQGDMAEVKMGTLAQAQGTSEAVKRYGATLVTDHGNHQVRVTALARSKAVKLPTDVNAAQKAAYAHLASLHGAAFDSAFKEHMIEDHQKDIADYTVQASSTDADIARLADETLPVLQKHLALAQGL